MAVSNRSSFLIGERFSKKRQIGQLKFKRANKNTLPSRCYISRGGRGGYFTHRIVAQSSQEVDHLQVLHLQTRPQQVEDFSLPPSSVEPERLRVDPSTMRLIRSTLLSRLKKQHGKRAWFYVFL